MCSLEHDQTINIGPRRRRKCIDIPAGVSLEDALKIYEQGWGHSLAASLHYFVEHVDVIPEYGSDFQSDEFIEYMNEKRKVKNVHFKET